MVKTCPLTNVNIASITGCPKTCAFLLRGGCAIILAAQFSEKALTSAEKTRKQIGA